MIRGAPSTTISKRAVLIGALLIIANSYWIAYVEMLWHTAHLTIVAMSVNVMFAILMTTWLNMAVRSTFPKAALSQQDLLAIYAMLAVGSAFSGHDCMPRLMGLMPYAFRFATPENDWEALLFHHLPQWLVISDPQTVTDFYEGEVNFFTEGYARHWITPILSWSIVIFLLMVIFLCLIAIIRRQWVAHEKLAYPIIQIPLEITARSGAIFRNRMLWLGFAIAAGIDLLNGLQFFFPNLPSIPVKKYNLNIYFTQKPWNAIGNTPLRFSPYLIGLAFILPLDLSFSCVFFYFMKKAQFVFGSMAGVMTLPGYPFLGEQGAGALFALLAVACWSGRGAFCDCYLPCLSPQSGSRSGRGNFLPMGGHHVGYLSSAIDVILRERGNVDLGVCCLRGRLPVNRRWVDAHASRTGTANSRHRLCHAAVPDDLHAWYAASRGGKLDDALPDELAQWRQVCLISDAPDARSARSLQTG